MLGLPYIVSPESVHVFTKVSGLIWFTVRYVFISTQMTISKVCSHLQFINIALVLLSRILCIQLELAHNVTIYIEQKVSGININIHSLFINL